jgi:hypothetical protein
MIYKFYWFLPALEDIYYGLSETPNCQEVQSISGVSNRRRNRPGITHMFTCDRRSDIQSNIQMEEDINAE